MKSVSITNIAGFGEFTTPLAALVLLQGQNGVGKSALQGCIKYQFAKGHDPDLVAPEIEGEIVTEFDEGSQIRTVVTKEQTRRMYKPADGKRWIIKREFIDTISNAVSYDPLAFLRMSDKDQIAEILRIMPIEVDPLELEETLKPLGEDTGREIAASVDVSGRSPLEVVNTIRDAVYTARTEQNVGADTLEKAASELDTTLRSLTVDGTDWAAEVNRLGAELAGIDSEENRLRSECNSRVREIMSSETSRKDRAVAAEERRVQELIHALQNELVKFKADRSSDMDVVVNEVKAMCRSCMDEFTSTKEATRDRLQAQLAQAQQSREIASRVGYTQGMISKHRADAVAKRAKQTAMTETLQRIDAFKAEIAARLPLPCTIYQGRICREENGIMVPFTKWNDASKYSFCLKLGVMAHGAAGFICIDSGGFDAFDPENRKAFMAAARHYVEAEGLQFIIASVGSGPLQVIDATDYEVTA